MSGKDTPFHSLREYLDGGGYKIVVMGDGGRSAVPMKEDDARKELAYAEALDAWVSRMPDAGFNEDDPRWSWWHERPSR